MKVHGDIPLGDAWGYLRDNLKPTTPYSADCIAIAHEFEQPSRAHLKRLKRLRTPVTPVRPRSVPDTTARAHHNEAARYGRMIERLLKPNSTAPARPLPKGALPGYARDKIAR